jgi:hypothetical protein
MVKSACRFVHVLHNVQICACTCTFLFGLIEVVFLWGGMNSWFLYEFTVFSMGSISAYIMNNLGKFDYAMSVMVLGSNISVTGP